MADSGAPPDAGKTPVGDCNPDPTSTGNARNVGMYCTEGGNQCSANPSAKFCAIDLDPEGGRFCIQLGCTSHEACGEKACCTGRENNPIKACIPSGCVADDAGTCPPIPGLEDAGSRPDAG